MLITNNIAITICFFPTLMYTARMMQTFEVSEMRMCISASDDFGMTIAKMCAGLWLWTVRLKTVRSKITNQRTHEEQSNTKAEHGFV